MPNINDPIGPQTFELVRDAIYNILVDELPNQYVLNSNDESLNAQVYLERTNPISQVEGMVVNVSIFSGDTEDQRHDMTVSDNDMLYAIDCYSTAKENGSGRGDRMSTLRLHRLMGVCRSILMNQRYKTLDGQIIGDRNVNQFLFADPGKQDGSFTRQGRLIIKVRVFEESPLGSTQPFAGNTTQAKLGLTDKGYQYINNET